MASKGAEIRAGVVVLLGLGVLALGLFLVSGGMDRFRDKRLYTIEFADAGGIQAGDAVYLAGQRIGSVVRVEARESGDTRVVAVTVEVYESALVHENAKFTISKTITGIVTMNILYGSGRPATATSVLRGSKLATFEEAIDEATMLVKDARQAVADLKEAMAGARRIVADMEAKDFPGQVDAVVKTAQRAVTHAEALLGKDESDLRATIADAREASAHLRRTLAQLETDYRESLSPAARAALADLRAAAQKADGILAENRERIRLIMQNVEDASLRIAPALARIEGLARSADETITEVRPKLVGTIENARRAMANFESLTQDLKTAPWKLVNKPSDAETFAVHLYNAANLYTDAVGDVASGIEDLETLRRLGALADEEQRKTVEAAIARLNDALEEHDRRQKELVGLIVGAKPKN